MNVEERFAPWILGAVLALLLGLVGCQGLTNGTAAAQSTSTPNPASGAPAPTASLSASPASIQQGQSTTLTWQTQNATQVSIDGIGAVDPSGSRTVQPTQSTTYKLTASGQGGSVNATASVTVTVPPPPQYSLQSIQHIVFMMQENRSFDSYFGHLPQYWAANGYSPVQIDAEPADASNPNYERTGTVSAYHFATVCTQSLSPFWDESHVAWNLDAPTSLPGLMNGFVWTAANYARQTTETPAVTDKEGIRAMGYYTGADLNYYYFMASNFATSDRWFSPVMSRSEPNRLYGLGATTEGHVYPLNEDTPVPVMKGKNIFDLLQAANVSWKVYVTDPFTSPGNADTTLNDYPSEAGSPNIVPVSQYYTDLQNGTLPAVAFIESGYTTGQDEHPNNNVQTGATYASGLINALMTSSSWKSSVFILTYDEAGNFYDHVPAQQTVSPDGIAPVDLKSGDTCFGQAGQQPLCDFTMTGFRVPLLVISPFTKKHFVDHTTSDYTAILKFIETRFKLPSINKRDAAQPDMTQFFDFQNAPWLTPPSPPGQLNNGTCDYQTLQ